MDTTITTHQKNVSTFIHLSTFSKWFFPFGNFIAPLILWSAQKRKSAFIDTNGRSAINFQLSILLYMIAIAVMSIPFIIYQALKIESTNANFHFFDNHFHSNGDIESLSTLFIVMIVAGTLIVGLALFEIINVVSAALKASNGESYRYPLTINFISESTIIEEAQDSDTPNEVEPFNTPTDEA